MARVNAQAIEIIDLDKETMTNVDLTKHTYTQMTVLMEMQTELTSFSSAPINGAKFAVPAGFQQVQLREMK